MHGAEAFMEQARRYPVDEAVRLCRISAETFHALAEIQPFVNNPLFQKAVHYQVVDHTDPQQPLGSLLVAVTGRVTMDRTTVSLVTPNPLSDLAGAGSFVR